MGYSVEGLLFGTNDDAISMKSSDTCNMVGYGRWDMRKGTLIPLVVEKTVSSTTNEDFVQLHFAKEVGKRARGTSIQSDFPAMAFEYTFDPRRFDVHGI